MEGSNPKLGLTLSGGGFRATLYHLGVIRFLYDAGLLPNVTHVCSVSGGSILAAHLVLNWSRYTGSKEDFHSAVTEILAFIQKDIRGLVVRRWLFSLFTLLRWIPGHRWTRGRLLESCYAELYKDKTLKALGRSSESAAGAPELHLLATSMTTGNLCSFSTAGLFIDDSRGDRLIANNSLPIALAVAASSAFPPLFPPVRMTREILHVSPEEFPNDDYLADGGVFDNLGIRKLERLQERNKLQFDFILVSDAQGRFDWALGKHYGFLPTRATRTSDILMKRVSDLEYGFIEEISTNRNCKLVRCTLQDEVSPQEDPSAMPIHIQHDSRSIRTDLDSFSPLEIEVLVRRGYTTAWNAWKRATAAELPVGAVQTRPWALTALPGIIAGLDAGSADLSGSRNHKWRLWSPRDWVSWATLVPLLLVMVILACPYVLQRIELAQVKRNEKALVDEQQQVKSEKDALQQQVKSEKDALVDEQKKRRQLDIPMRKLTRPVQPGISVSRVDATATTICCVVQDKQGRRFLLGSGFDFAGDDDPQDRDLILQPGRIDGGRNPDDAVAQLTRWKAGGAIAQLLPGIEASPQIPGIGAIRGLASSVKDGEELLKVGRTTGTTRGKKVGQRRESIPVGSQRTESQDLIVVRSDYGPFALGGDGGAPVLTTDRKLVGMFYGTDELNNSYVLPIKSILDALEVELVP